MTEQTPSIDLDKFDMASVDAVATLAHILKCPIRRISSLYKVRTKQGDLIPFMPNPEQKQVLHEYFVKGNRKLLILKARQLGMSTLIAIIMTDNILFSSGSKCSIIDRKLLDAAQKLREKVRDVFETLPSIIKNAYEIVRSHDSEFSIRKKSAGGEPDSASYCFAGTNARGGTNNILHISEWGPIQFSDPKRSKEILTGALPSATEGSIFNESTWMGGKMGALWDITERAIFVKANPNLKTSSDWTLLFFPWYTDPALATRGDASQVSDEVRKYFEELREHPEVIESGHVFTEEQILWYYVEAMKLGDERFREYPSVLEECFKAPIHGAIWQKHVERARVEGRIGNVPHSENSLVYTSWDLGSPKNTRVVYYQIVNGMINVIDHDTGLDLLPVARVAHMNEKGYKYGNHFFPHDGSRQEYSGLSFSTQMAAAGLKNIKLIPRTREVWTGINEISALMSRFCFDSKKCEKLLSSMSCYHVKLEDDDPEKPTSEIVHDESSHDCDAIRYIAEAMSANLVTLGTSYTHLVETQRYEEAKKKAALEADGWNRSRGYHGSYGGYNPNKANTGSYKLRH